MNKLIEKFILWYMGKRWDRDHQAWFERDGFVVRLYSSVYYWNHED